MSQADSCLFTFKSHNLFSHLLPNTWPSGNESWEHSSEIQIRGAGGVHPGMGRAQTASGTACIEGLLSTYFHALNGLSLLSYFGFVILIPKILGERHT